MTQRITMAAILKLELPDHVVRLSDGGTVTVAGETFLPRDPVLGVADSFESLTEGVGDEAPAGMITFLPPDDVPASVLNASGNQGSRLRLYVVEVDADTGLTIGLPEQLVDWIVDTTAMVVGAGKHAVEVAFVSGGDRLFQIDRGNALSPGFHRGVHPGEAGLDNASGVETAVAWGAASAARGTTASFGGGGGGAGSIQGAVAYA